MGDLGEGSSRRVKISRRQSAGWEGLVIALLGQQGVREKPVMELCGSASQ